MSSLSRQILVAEHSYQTGKKHTWIGGASAALAEPVRNVLRLEGVSLDCSMQIFFMVVHDELAELFSDVVRPRVPFNETGLAIVQVAEPVTARCVAILEPHSADLTGTGAEAYKEALKDLATVRVGLAAAKHAERVVGTSVPKPECQPGAGC